MATKNTGLIPILLMFCAMLIGGCGWITGGDNADNASPKGASSLAAVSKAVGIYTITTVTPNQGFLFGGENVFIQGVFPAVANAINIYKVYFGANIAPYVPLVPSFTLLELNVTAPPGDALGFVDVWLFDTIANIYYANLPNGYKYIPSMELISIVPENGPICVKNPIEVITRLPAITADVTDLATAVSMYRVTIDGFPCAYDLAANPFLKVNGDGPSPSS